MIATGIVELARRRRSLEGQRLALTKLAEEKFGTLESRYTDAIARASEEQLRQWLKDILTAAAAGDLFQS